MQRLPTIPGRPRAVAVGAAGVVLAALFAYLWAHDYTGPHHGQFDLAIYWNAVRFWADGNHLYDYAQYDPVNVSLGFTYPPLAAVLMRPMLLLGLPATVVLSVAAIVAAAALSVLLCVRERFALRGGRLAVTVGVATAALFTLEPVRQTLAYGQINLYLAVLVLGDLLVLGRRRSRWTGLGVGLAMA
ncbi:hypothetical protein GCM10011594_15120 [Nakamurella endophytica]|uniref:DUF2029 domain-containing protein n=1 Tax=Nakamurella endophytica TaxID=1748367 RepID=A0A917WE62_9ACTN|nr:hypothetical protein GCM10011594_15120 [Nakamurella endophytica]